MSGPGGVSPIFQGGVSNFSGGSPIFQGQGECLQKFFFFFFNFFPHNFFWDAHPPLRRSMHRRYASYWNAFLFVKENEEGTM